jgi:transcriptional regulator with XRE-family HTH domain
VKPPASTHELDQIALEFDLPRPLPEELGTLDLDAPLRAILIDAIAHARQQRGLTRERIADRMTELTGIHVSKAMLDAWTAESRTAHRFPMQWAAAFELATGTLALTAWLAQSRGCQLLSPADVIDAELGRLDRQTTELREKRKKLLLLRAADSRPGSDA